MFGQRGGVHFLFVPLIFSSSGKNWEAGTCLLLNMRVNASLEDENVGANWVRKDNCGCSGVGRLSSWGLMGSGRVGCGELYAN